ncbi:MAG: hypothetical protein M3Z92_10380 [Bacteroidota bacterium]|nr:hypothetical protein [Bacteroidota bacterium]
MSRKLIQIAGVVFISFIQFFGLAGCEKEYSYEGGIIADTIPIVRIDTIPKPSTDFPFCPACAAMNPSAVLFWSFKYDTSLLCGTVTNAVITPDRDGFTFFGPSACSSDTGLVMTVFLDMDSLNRDKNNITTNNVALEYYDNTTFNDIFIANRRSLYFIIETYNHSTGIAKGTFNGNVTLKNGTQKAILGGRFVIQF